jgi:hypothetical protein
MPKAHIHEGPFYSLIPQRTSSDDQRSPAEITDEAHRTHDWSSHYYERGSRAYGEIGDGVEPRQEPSVILHWSKQRENMNENGPGDHGFVNLELEVDEEMLRGLLAGIDRERAESAEKGIGTPVGRVRLSVVTTSLSWRDLNMLARAAREARDGAFGKPE